MSITSEATKKKMKVKNHKFDLLENAKDSLSHAVLHLTTKEYYSTSNIKRVILDISHVVELLLKERLYRIHPAFIWENIDKYPNSLAYMVGANKALTRLLNLEGIKLSDESKKTIKICREVRNSIEHFEFEIEEKKAKVIIGRILSFIFSFIKDHLNLDWEQDFKNDENWSTLVSIHEFWEAHSKALEEKLIDEGEAISECPSCHANTFNLSISECVLCGHIEERITCDTCSDEFWESDTETFEGIDGDENGYGHYSYTLCIFCLAEEDKEEIGY